MSKQPYQSGNEIDHNDFLSSNILIFVPNLDQCINIKLKYSSKCHVINKITIESGITVSQVLITSRSWYSDLLLDAYFTNID